MNKYMQTHYMSVFNWQHLAMLGMLPFVIDLSVLMPAADTGEWGGAEAMPARAGEADSFSMIPVICINAT